MRISLSATARAASAAFPLLAFLLVAFLLVAASSTPVRAQPTQVATSSAPVAVFLDCGFECDQEFTRTEITYVDWVRDRVAADVHVLVTSQRTGGGGRDITLAFLGQRRFAGLSDTLSYVAGQNNSDDDTRRGFTRTLGVGLARYVARTPLANRLQVTLGAAAEGAVGASAGVPRRDPWDLWVYSVGANTNVNGEKSSSFRSLGANISARRTTEQWKLVFQARQNYNRSEFSFDDQTSTFIRRFASVNQLAVRSMGPRLSTGLRSSVSSSTFENKRFAFRVTPAIEFDVFPYSEVTRRLLTVQYAVGVEGFDYLEETIFRRTSETRPLHTLQVQLSQNQPWGSVNVTIDGGQYLDETNKNFASLSGGTSVRLFKGLNFNMSASFASIHNQLYIPRRDASEEEVLTQQRRLATDFSYFAFTGLSYTFGSVLNNVVNPRFGRGDGGGSSCFCN